MQATLQQQGATQQQMQATLQQQGATQQQMQATLQQQGATQQQMQAALARMELTAVNGLHMSKNASSFARTDSLHPIMLGAPPAAPPHFPATRGALEALQPARVQGLCAAYNIPLAPAASRFERLKVFIGVRLC
jgi:hypothetical protein